MQKHLLVVVVAHYFILNSRAYIILGLSVQNLTRKDCVPIKGGDILSLHTQSK